MITFEPTPLGDPSAPDWQALAREPRALAAGLRPAFVANGDAQANLDRLLAGALCVTTGQQPGLFTGPLFTVYKALSAVALARNAESALGRPVVPVFWVAGDDHDFAEANHVFVLNAKGDVERVELRQRASTAALTPLYRETLGPDVVAAIQRIAELTPEAEFKGSALEWLSRHYRPETDFASAFGGALAELLGAHGLVVFYANHPSAKRAMAPLLGRALAGAGDLDRSLAARARELGALGRDVPVVVGEGATTVMVEGSLGRDRLVLRDGQYVTRRSGESWDAGSVARLLETSPGRFSPNVLLRPVVEAAILPTLAYAGGPGELAYLEQADPLYEGLDVAPQARIPRWSGRVIEARVARALEKQGITADALETEGARLEADLLREEIPAGARAAMQRLRSELEREYQAIGAAALEVDPTLQKPVESARNAALAGVSDIEKRLIAHLKKRNDITTSQISRARASLFPQGQPQERILSTVSFLGRYGPPFLAQASSAIHLRAGSLEPAHRRS